MNISEFVVGLSMDAADFNRGVKGAEVKLSALKSSILQTGAALGAAFSFKGLTIDFAKQVNEARQLAQFLGISTNNLVSMQRVAESFGADIGEMNGLFSGIAQAKAGLDVGKIGIFQDLAKSGINIDDLIGAKDANEAVLRLAAQLKKIGSPSTRRNVAGALGLTPATLDMLLQGRKRIEELQHTFEDMRPVTKEAEAASKEWIAGLTELKTHVGRSYDALSTEVLKGVNGIVSSINAWLTSNQKLIDQVTGPAFKLIGENVGAIAVGLGAFGSVAVLGGIGKLTTALGGLAGIMGGLAISSKAIGGTLALLTLFATNPEDIFGEDIGKVLNMTPSELWDALKKKMDYQDVPIPESAYTFTEGGAAIMPAVAAGDVSGSADAPSSVKAGSGARATVKATIPVQITTNTNLPESTISRTVTRIMNRELDAALVRGDF